MSCRRHTVNSASPTWHVCRVPDRGHTANLLFLLCARSGAHGKKGTFPLSKSGSSRPCASRVPTTRSSRPPASPRPAPPRPRHLGWPRRRRTSPPRHPAPRPTAPARRAALPRRHRPGPPRPPAARGDAAARGPLRPRLAAGPLRRRRLGPGIAAETWPRCRPSPGRPPPRQPQPTSSCLYPAGPGHTPHHRRPLTSSRLYAGDFFWPFLCHFIAIDANVYG